MRPQGVSRRKGDSDAASVASRCSTLDVLEINSEAMHPVVCGLAKLGLTEEDTFLQAKDSTGRIT